tara:strand:+ start:1812 stop:2573 length:762 start_codon:yes stop_codon:yes gene_type:complete
VKKNKYAIYTSINNNYDQLADHKNDDKFDFFVFTDDELKASNWSSVPFQKTFKNVIDTNRYAKIKVPNFIYKNYDYSVYVDGNIFLKEKFFQKVKILFENDNFFIGANLHPRFNCVFQDLVELQRVGILDGYSALAWAKKISELGIFKNSLYHECNIILRKHHDYVGQFCDTWWEYFKSGYGRDQPAFRIARFKHPQMHIKSLELGDIRDSKNLFANCFIHKKKKSKIIRLKKRLKSIINFSEMEFKFYINQM